jgi:hypothetical protein
MVFQAFIQVFRFETWIEEGKAKFEIADQQSKSNFASLGS